jgi:flagellar protein FliT
MNMADGHYIIAQYTEIAAITKRMLDAARSSEWDTLCDLERDCGKYFERLLESGEEQPDDNHYRSRKAALIRGILDDDAEIRLLVEPWLAQLSQLIGSTQQQSRLHNAYRVGE